LPARATSDPPPWYVLQLSHVSNGHISGINGAEFVDKTQSPPATTTNQDVKGIDKCLEGVLPGLKGPVTLTDAVSGGGEERRGGW